MFTEMRVVLTRVVRLILLGVILEFNGTIGTAQVRVETVSEKMSLGTNQGFKVWVEGADEKTATSVVRDWLKQYGKVKKMKDELVIDDAIVSELSDHPIDIFAYVKEENGGAAVYLFFNLGGAFLNPADHPEMSRTAEKMLEKLGKQIGIEEVNEMLYEAERELKELEQKKQQLLREKESLEKRIEDCQKTIEESKHKLEVNAEEQKKTDELIKNQQAKIEEIQKMRRKFE